MRIDDALTAARQPSSPSAGLSVIQAIGRQSGQARILDRATGGEVIERLKRRVVESKHLMDRVIEKAADSRRTDASRLRLQVKHLADHAGLPEKPAVEP